MSCTNTYSQLSLSEKLNHRVAQVSRLDSALADVNGLVSALQFLCVDFDGTSVEDAHLVRIRAAIVGISNALEASLKGGLDERVL